MSDHDSASDVSFGAWIQQRRKALDLTQDELARRVGCSPSAIRKIESDERRPSRQVAELHKIDKEMSLIGRVDFAMLAIALLTMATARYWYV